MPSDRDGLLCIVEKFPVPGREGFFLDSTFHRSGLLGNVLLKGYVSMSSCYISSFKSGTTFGGYLGPESKSAVVPELFPGSKPVRRDGKG